MTDWKNVNKKAKEFGEARSEELKAIEAERDLFRDVAIPEAAQKLNFLTAQIDELRGKLSTSEMAAHHWEGIARSEIVKNGHLQVVLDAARDLLDSEATSYEPGKEVSIGRYFARLSTAVAACETGDTE